MKSLDKESLFNAILSGATTVIKNKNHLNDINVFPVADGDTGTNLASLMHTLINEPRLSEDLETTLEELSDAALTGARGNSGIIFAGYLNGLFSDISTSPVKLDDFHRALKSAVPYAYDAISNPVEGTMITLMKALPELFKKNQKASFGETFKALLPDLKIALDNTTNQLKVLKDNNVIDSGALGFYFFIEGMSTYFENGKKVAKPDTDDTLIKHQPGHKNEEETHRYCTEALIETNEKVNLKTLLSPFGDSLVIAKNPRKTRIHIHTDHPADFFFTLREHATIIDQKVDDMKKQHDAAYHKKHDIALVTDSIADLPKSFIDEHQIFMVPIQLMIEDTTYYDKLTITTPVFYSMMDTLKTYPTSSQPNVKTLENFFSFLTSYYKEVIVLTVSEKMSGTYNAFKQALTKFESPTITLIDSKQNSVGQGLIVKQVAEMIEQKTAYKKIIKETESLIEKTTILVSVNTLKYMVRSGRVSKVTGVVAKLLNLKPVVSIDETGEGIIADKAISVKSNTKKIFNTLKAVHENSPIKSYAVVHARDYSRAEYFASIAEEITGLKPDYIDEISSVIAMNAGIGSVAIAFTTK